MRFHHISVRSSDVQGGNIHVQEWRFSNMHKRNKVGKFQRMFFYGEKHTLLYVTIQYILREDTWDCVWFF